MHPCRVGGFKTVKTDSVYPGRFSVHLLRPEADAPAEENFLFFCMEPIDSAVLARFNALGCRALQNAENYDLILMDELGPAETQATPFKKAVISVLRGNTPVLGVIQKSPSDFLEQIASFDNVRVIEVTEENRDSLIEIM